MVVILYGHISFKNLKPDFLKIMNQILVVRRVSGAYRVFRRAYFITVFSTAYYSSLQYYGSTILPLP
jgi:hypothetical protein